MNSNDFLIWEQLSRDTIDVKRAYIDIAEDLVAGILLSQIIYWNLPNQEGKSKLRVKKNDELWLAKSREDWWEECRITPKQYDRAIKMLENKNLIEKQIFKFNGTPTTHIRLNLDVLTQCLSDITQRGKTEEPSEHRILPKGEYRYLPKGNIDITQRGISITENTTKITTEITNISQSVIEEDKKSQSIEKKTDRLTDFKNIELYFEEKLNLQDIKEHNVYDTQLIDEIQLNILEMYFNDYTMIKNEKKPQMIVRSALMQLTYSHIEALIRKYKNISHKINNPKAYIQSMIYNIAFESDLSITNEVKYTMGY